MKITVLLLSLLFFSAGYSSAQTADQIIDRYIEARGGKEKLSGMKTIFMQGSRESPENISQFEIVIDNGKFYREDITYPNGSYFEVITDSLERVMYRKTKKGVTRMPDSVAKKRMYKLDIEGGLINYSSKGHTAEYLGMDYVNGHECYKIRFISNMGVWVYYWFDAKTYLKVQSAVTEKITRVAPVDKPLELIIADTISYLNYRDVDGVLFPFTQMMKMYSAKLQKTVGYQYTYYSKIELNRPINPKLYKLK